LLKEKGINLEKMGKCTTKKINVRHAMAGALVYFFPNLYEIN